jgi:uncharacterized GH25 family protein
MGRVMNHTISIIFLTILSQSISNASSTNNHNQRPTTHVTGQDGSKSITLPMPKSWSSMTNEVGNNTHNHNQTFTVTATISANFFQLRTNNIPLKPTSTKK